MSEIPDDIHEAANRAIYVPGFPGGDMPTAVLERDIQAIVVGAIMAERERCAEIADTYFMRWPDDGSAYWRERRTHSTDIASSIRNTTVTGKAG